MAVSKSTGQPPAFRVPVQQTADQAARARKLARLESLAASLRSAAADCPPNDPELRSRIMAAGTAAAQLVAYLRRQEPVAAQIERLTAERRAALAEMRSLAGSPDMDTFRAVCAREAQLAAQIRKLRQGGAA
jgi:hypothetical protein